VLVSRSTRDALGDRIVATPVEGLQLKGIATPVTGYVVESIAASDEGDLA
jgi:class 3 adenylate cyclase